ncbi:hypothetical protein DFAR_660015 [Desulfarculales bacterium]
MQADNLNYHCHLLGQWQQIVVLDLDNHPRCRQVVIQVLRE